MNSKEVLTEQLNEALAIWQNSMTNLPLEPTDALNKVISNNRKLAENIAESISNYIKGLSVQINKTTNFGSIGMNIAVPWTTQRVSLLNSNNHAYIKEDEPKTTEIQIGRLGGVEQYKRILSYPSIIRI